MERLSDSDWPAAPSDPWKSPGTVTNAAHSGSGSVEFRAHFCADLDRARIRAVRAALLRLDEFKGKSDDQSLARIRVEFENRIRELESELKPPFDFRRMATEPLTKCRLSQAFCRLPHRSKPFLSHLLESLTLRFRHSSPHENQGDCG